MKARMPPRLDFPKRLDSFRPGAMIAASGLLQNASREALGRVYRSNVLLVKRIDAENFPVDMAMFRYCIYVCRKRVLGRVI